MYGSIYRRAPRLDRGKPPILGRELQRMRVLVHFIKRITHVPALGGILSIWAQFITVCQAVFVPPKGAYLQQGSLFQPQWYQIDQQAAQISSRCSFHAPSCKVVLPSYELFFIPTQL